MTQNNALAQKKKATSQKKAPGGDPGDYPEIKNKITDTSGKGHKKPKAAKKQNDADP